MRAKSSPRSLAALLAAGVTLVTLGGLGLGGVVTLPVTDNGDPTTTAVATAATIGSNATVPIATQTVAGQNSDVSVKLNLMSHPAHAVCANLFTRTGALPAGCPLIATVTVANNGSSPATNVVVTAPQPWGWMQPEVTHPTSGCTLANGSSADLTCNLGTLAPGATEQIVVQGTTSPSTPQEVLSSVVRVSVDGVDLTPETSVDAGILQVVPQADLSVVYVPSGGALRPGDQATWTAVVTNNGPSTANNVRIFQALGDFLDAQFDDVTITTNIASDPSGNAVENPDAVVADNPATELSTCKMFDQNNATARCRVTFLDPGDTATMVVTGILSSSIDDANQLIKASVGVSSDTIDPDNSNNNADISIRTTDPEANLMIGTTGPAGVAPGERVTWTITVEDGGPSDAPNVRLDLNLPAVLTDVLVSSDHGPCDITGCDLGTLLASVEPDMPGNTADIAIAATVSPGATGTFTLSGSVSAAEQYPHAAPATTSFDVFVDTTAQAGDYGSDESQADIQISELLITPVDASYVGPGSQRRIQFTVTNAGPDPAQFPWFRLSRSIDAEANLTDDMQSRCQTTPREIMCAVTDQQFMAVGESIDIDYTITLTSIGKAGNYTDYVRAYSQTQDPDETNNSTQADIIVGPSATALALEVNAVNTTPNPGSPAVPGSTTNPSGADSFIAGSRFTYQIQVYVPQDGLADASNVVVEADLPAGFSAVSAISASGLCSIVGSHITCKLPIVSAVDQNSGARITINGIVDPQTRDLYSSGTEWVEKVPFTVTATTTTPGVDGAAVTATDSCNVDIIEEADLELFVTPDQGGTADANSVGYTLTVLNEGPSGIGNAAVSFVVPDGYQLDLRSSDCKAPPTSGVDVRGNGTLDLTPVATGFTPTFGTSVICLAGTPDSGGHPTGNLASGQAGNARVVLRRTQGASSYASTVEFTAGSLATDPNWANNYVTAPLQPASDATIAPAGDTMTVVDQSDPAGSSTSSIQSPLPAPIGTTNPDGELGDCTTYPQACGNAGLGSLDVETDLPNQSTTQ